MSLVAELRLGEDQVTPRVVRPKPIDSGLCQIGEELLLASHVRAARLRHWILLEPCSP